MLWLLCFGLNVVSSFTSVEQSCSSLPVLGFIPLLFSSPYPFFVSLDDFRSLLVSQSVSVHRKIKRKPLTFQAKTKPVRVAINFN